MDGIRRRRTHYRQDIIMFTKLFKRWAVFTPKYTLSLALEEKTLPEPSASSFVETVPELLHRASLVRLVVPPFGTLGSAMSITQAHNDLVESIKNTVTNRLPEIVEWFKDNTQISDWIYEYSSDTGFEWLTNKKMDVSVMKNPKLFGSNKTQLTIGVLRIKDDAMCLQRFMNSAIGAIISANIEQS